MLPNRKDLQQSGRLPLTELVRLGKLEDILKSQASPELKAACIEMAAAGSAVSRKFRQAGK